MRIGSCIGVKNMKIANYLQLGVAALALIALPAHAGTTGYFIYDEAGHVIGEYDANGNPVQEHIYVDDRPVAVSVMSGTTTTLDYVTTDQLDTPRDITDGSGAVIWSWDSDPFGNGQPTGSITYNLRFPGQYYDVETGHNYNYFRDYDPVTGRYIESDPIGLRGGINTYVYGLGNPIENVDPRGLDIIPIPDEIIPLAGETASQYLERVSNYQTQEMQKTSAYKGSPDIFPTESLTPKQSWWQELLQNLTGDPYGGVFGPSYRLPPKVCKPAQPPSPPLPPPDFSKGCYAVGLCV